MLTSLPLVAETGPPGRGVAILSTYPPTQCGLATFTAALRAHLGTHGFPADVVRVLDRPEASSAPEVVADLVHGDASSAVRAVRLLDRYDAVLVQHEFGIFGGLDGEDVLPLLQALSAPVLVVLHTVLEHPTAHQREVLQAVLAVASAVVTMTDTGRERLLRSYGVHPDTVTTIPHGAEPHLFAALPRPARRPARPARPLVLTWGLLGPGKGIEWAIDGLPALRDLDPRYLVLGRTHPKVAAWQGEAYRDSLVERAHDRGVADLVEFDDSYLSVTALAGVVASADVVLLPYDSREQVTSGVLVEAVTAGRPVVATAFPHAVELLTDGPGLVVPQRDSTAVAHALRRVLTEPGLGADLAGRASAAAPALHWSAVADRYRELLQALAPLPAAAAGRA